MAAFDFPSPASVGQIYTAPTGQSYIYDGVVWNVTNVSPQAPVASDNPPSNPYAGQLWLRSTTGALYMWYVDQNSSQWIQIPGNNAAPGLWEPLLSKEYAVQTVNEIVKDIGAYRSLRTHWEGNAHGADAVIGMQISSDNGATFATTAIYTLGQFYNVNAGAIQMNQTNQIGFAVANAIPSDGGVSIAHAWVGNFNKPAYKIGGGDNKYLIVTGSNHVNVVLELFCGLNVAMNAVKFLIITGGPNVTGHLTLEGMRA